MQAANSIGEAVAVADWTEPLVRRLIDENDGAEPEQIIRDYADRLRRDACETKLPINVDLIRSCLGIRRREGDYDFAGRIYAEESGQLVMNLRSTDSLERQRFTCAHELIHPAFPGFTLESRYRLDTQVGGNSVQRAEEEYLCDLGAAELLMPTELVRESYSAADGLDDVERLAADAEVSLEAAANRLVQLSDEPTLLLVLEVMHKPADARARRRGEQVEPKLRVRYCIANETDCFVPKFKSADDGSVFVKTLRSVVPQRAVEPLPGSSDPLFQIEAQHYPFADRQRVLALAWPRS
jgi:Zn-dependent peptidase ImmA (M78 family)